MFENIVPQSAGSLAVAILGLLMVILQVLFRLKSRHFKWVGWSAAVSFSGMLYAVGVFLEYNSPPGNLNRFAGALEWAALICLIHCLYGLTFSYFNLNGKSYHIVATIFHGLVLIMLFSTDYLVADHFVSIDFKWLSSPYKEVALGPLGPLFESYAALASVAAFIFWIRYKGPDSGYRYAYITGIGCWIVFGIHDALASLGVPSAQYFMEYGYFAFSIAVMWVLFSSFADVSGENKYRVITEFTNDGILVIQDRRVVFGNPAAGKLFGAQIVGSGIEDTVNIIIPEDRSVLLDNYRKLLETGVFPAWFMARYNRENGELGTVEVRASLIRYRNKPAVLGVLRDVTEKIRDEETRRESEEKIFRLKKMESLGLLAGGVAHDLNNVLSGIINYPELMLMNLPMDSPLRKPVEAIKKSGFKAVAIVQDLLTITRGVAIQKETLNLNDVVREYLISPEHKKLLDYHPLVTVRKELAPSLLNIEGSAIHVGKVVMNLVSNASEAVREHGSVIISTRNRYLERPLKGFEEIPVGEYATLSVKDTGPGISPDDLKRIFEPFFSKKTLGRSGTGLGLALVWNTMQDHGGYIDIVSEDQGTTFDMYLPVSQKTISEKPDTISLEDLHGRGEMILIVDDVESQREISRQMLEKLNYRTKAVASGEEAVAYLKTHRVDLLLLDMIMDPGMNGRDTYEQAVKIHPGQKAIIVSGFTKTDLVLEAQASGAGRYLKKPVLLAELGTAVKEVLGNDEQ